MLDKQQTYVGHVRFLPPGKEVEGVLELFGLNAAAMPGALEGVSAKAEYAALIPSSIPAIFSRSSPYKTHNR